MTSEKYRQKHNTEFDIIYSPDINDSNNNNVLANKWSNSNSHNNYNNNDDNKNY